MSTNSTASRDFRNEDERQLFVAIRDYILRELGSAENRDELLFSDTPLAKFRLADDMASQWWLQVEDLLKRLDKERPGWQTLDAGLGGLIFPYGKYKDRQLADIPLNYLDQLYHSMDDSWFKRRLAEFLDQPSLFVAMSCGPCYRSLHELQSTTNREA